MRWTSRRRRGSARPIDAALASGTRELTIVCPPGPVGRVLDLSGVGELIPRTS